MGQALQLILIPVFMAQWDKEEPWGPRRCCAKKRRTHLPTTLFGSAYAKQGSCLQNTTNGRPDDKHVQPLTTQEVCWFGVIYAIRTKQG